MAGVKQANRLVGTTTRKEHTSQLQPLQGGRAVFSAPSFCLGSAPEGSPCGFWKGHFLEQVCDRRGDLITLMHREGGGERIMTMSLHGAKGERDLKQRVWNVLTVKICGRRAPVLLGALLNSVCLSSDPQKGRAPW